jgi:hypothetical protein
MDVTVFSQIDPHSVLGTAAILSHLQDPDNKLIKDRRWRMLKFKSCLEATETVSSVVASGLAKNREEAVTALRRIVETGCLAHVANQHHFEDKYLFFRIVDNVSANTFSSGLPTFADAKESPGSKHGRAKVRSQGRTRKKRYLVLADGVLYEYPNEHAPRPILSLPLSACRMGTVSYCGNLEKGTFGVSITPPVCESCETDERNGNGAGEGDKDRDRDRGRDRDRKATGESKGESKRKGESKAEPDNAMYSAVSTITKTGDVNHSEDIVLLFDSAKDQESWLQAFVKAGLTFEESASPSAREAKSASSLLDFKVKAATASGATDVAYVDLKEMCQGKVTVVVNVASF